MNGRSDINARADVRTLLGGMPLPRRVAMFRALQLGDLLCTVPALRALRGALPEAEITLVGLPWAGGFVQRFSAYLDRFVAIPGWPGLPERPTEPAAIPAFLAGMQAQQYDLVLQMHGSGGVTNPLAALFGGGRTAGYVEPGAYAPDPELFMPYPHGEHEVRTHLRLMEFLGIRGHGEELEFPVLPADAAELAAALGDQSLTRDAYACLHPGARAASRRWPAERFAAVGDALAARGLRIVLTGSAEERTVTGAVARAMHTPPLDLAGRTSLGALALLTRDAALVVTNDTGMSHIAASVHTPSVVLALAADPARWAPLDQRRHRVVMHPVECRPCGLTVCPIGHPCATGIMPDEVIAAADTVLAGVAA